MIIELFSPWGRGIGAGLTNHLLGGIASMEEGGPQLMLFFQGFGKGEKPTLCFRKDQIFRSRYREGIGLQEQGMPLLWRRLRCGLREELFEGAVQGYFQNRLFIPTPGLEKEEFSGPLLTLLLEEAEKRYKVVWADSRGLSGEMSRVLRQKARVRLVHMPQEPWAFSQNKGGQPADFYMVDRYMDKSHYTWKNLFRMGEMTETQTGFMPLSPMLHDGYWGCQMESLLLYAHRQRKKEDWYSAGVMAWEKIKNWGEKNRNWNGL